MLLIGDIHALFDDYKKIIKRSGAKESLQLGDFGLGFPDTMVGPNMSKIEGTHRFIRGNHDNPEVCRKNSQYVGDYGTMSGSFIEDRFKKLFYLSGAWSIDQEWRTEGISWWPDEQLSYKELTDATNLYEEEKPDIMCTHDCPTFILQQMYPARVIPTKTSQAMEVMFQIYKPSYWFFAHHHTTWRRNINDCLFVCLNELQTIDISEPVHF